MCADTAAEGACGKRLAPVMHAIFPGRLDSSALLCRLDLQQNGCLPKYAHSRYHLHPCREQHHQWHIGLVLCERNRGWRSCSGNHNKYK